MTEMTQKPADQEEREDHSHQSEKSSLHSEPLFAQLTLATQEGRWHDAERALAILEQRYSASPEIQQARQMLALRLSAEQSVPRKHRACLSILRTPYIRWLIVADLILYLLLAVLWLLWHSSIGPFR